MPYSNFANAYLIDPKFANNNVVHICVDLTPSIMTTAGTKCQMSNAKWNNLKIVTTKFTVCREILPIRPITMFDMEARDWWMMGNLNIQTLQYFYSVKNIHYPNHSYS